MEKKFLQRGVLYLVTHAATNHVEQGLTLWSGRNLLLSLWSDTGSTLNTFFKISKMRNGIKERKKISDTGWENREGI